MPKGLSVGGRWFQVPVMGFVMYVSPPVRTASILTKARPTAVLAVKETLSGAAAAPSALLSSMSPGSAVCPESW